VPRLQRQTSQDFRHGGRDIQRIGFLPHRLPRCRWLLGQARQIELIEQLKQLRFKQLRQLQPFVALNLVALNLVVEL